MFRLGLLRALTSSAQTPILPIKEGVPDVGISSRYTYFRIISVLQMLESTYSDQCYWG